MFAIFFVLAIGAFCYAMVSFLVTVMVWMFTTVFGLAFLGLMILMFIINLLTPEGDEEYDEEDEE